MSGGQVQLPVHERTRDYHQRTSGSSEQVAHKQSACNARNVAIVLIAIAAIAILIVGLLGFHDVIDIGEIGSKAMIGLSATALGGFILYAITACRCPSKRTPYEHVS